MNGSGGAAASAEAASDDSPEHMVKWGGGRGGLMGDEMKKGCWRFVWGGGGFEWACIVCLFY